ncbi:ankyrin repeat domain-containing protein 13D-like isoform X2 [Argonauta hians]
MSASNSTTTTTNTCTTSTTTISRNYTCSDVEKEFPLHWLVWSNNYQELETLLNQNTHNIEALCPRGRTPLHLAVTLGHFESAKTLMQHGANANGENAAFWSVLHEATGTGDPEMVQLALKYRDYQRYSKRSAGIPDLLQKLKESPDFYVEMKWEFTSWVPLVSRVCPSDVYRVWKSGSNVRIDTTLLGFDSMKWQRGSRSYIFKGRCETATVMEVDHDNQEVYTETIQIQQAPLLTSLLEPSVEEVAARLTSPIMTTFIDTDKIAFERNKSGIWGWRSDRTEVVNGYESKVFSASNVELVTKTRTEHMTEDDKERCKKVNKTPLVSFLGVAEEENKAQGATNGPDIQTVSYNPSLIKPEEYFDEECDLGDRDIGRPIEQSSKAQRFKATLWLCEDYPLSLPEQVVPIIDLMAASNAHFKKLRDFVTLQLPAGFPVKIEIPLFHVLNARITFGNIFGVESSPIEGVSCIQDEEGKLTCAIDDSVFDLPANYSGGGEANHERLTLRSDDDELLQYVIQQSMIEVGTENEQVTFWEALNKSPPAPTSATSTASTIEEQRQLQWVIAESSRSGTLEVDLGMARQPFPEPLGPSGTAVKSPCSEEEEQLRLAMEMSEKDFHDKEIQRKANQEELDRILKLSLIDK